MVRRLCGLHWRLSVQLGLCSQQRPQLESDIAGTAESFNGNHLANRQAAMKVPGGSWHGLTAKCGTVVSITMNDVEAITMNDVEAITVRKVL